MLHHSFSQPAGLANVYFGADSAAGSGTDSTPESASKDQSTAKEQAAYSAAQRFTEILTDNAHLKEFFKTLAVDPKKFTEFLNEEAGKFDKAVDAHKEQFDKAVEQKNKFLDELGKLRPDQAAKEAFTQFLSKAFTHKQIEYMLFLMQGLGSDPRIPELLNAVPKAVEVFGEVWVDALKKVAEPFKKIFDK